MNKKFLLITAAIAVGALGIAAIIYFTVGAFNRDARITVDESHSFGATDLSLISIRSSSMDVEVRGSTGSTVTASLSGTVWTSGADSAPSLDAVQTGDSLEIGVERPQVFGMISESLSLVVEIPAEFAGSISVRGGSGDLEIRDIALDRIDVELGSGRVETSGLTLSGDSRFETNSGRMELDLGPLAADLSLRAGSGDVRLALPADSGFELSAEAGSGKVETTFPVTITGTTGRGSDERLEGRVGDGGPLVMIRTGSGNIDVRRR